MKPYLMTSAMPARYSRCGQRLQRARVRDHAARLMERADHVLAVRMIDAGLAADGRVDLRQQRRRHLDVVDAALIAGGREAGHVADDAAAQSASTAASRFMRSATSASRMREKLSSVLCCSPSGRISVAMRRPCSAALQRREVQRRDRFVRDDQQVARGDVRRCSSCASSSRPRADQDRIAALAQRDVDAFVPRSAHVAGAAPAAAARMSSATARTWRPSVATTTLAIDSYSGARTSISSRSFASGSSV